MDKDQQKYSAFMESVCQQFNRPDAYPALKEGFKVFCESLFQEKRAALIGKLVAFMQPRIHPQSRTGSDSFSFTAFGGKRFTVSFDNSNLTVTDDSTGNEIYHDTCGLWAEQSQVRKRMLTKAAEAILWTSAAHRQPRY